jgi:hypothetical protein
VRRFEHRFCIIVFEERDGRSSRPAALERRH